MEWLKVVFGIFGMSGLLALIFWSNKNSSSFILQKWFFPFLSIRLAAGIGLGLIYFFYYGEGDTTAYHHDALIASNLAYQNFNEYVNLLFSGKVNRAYIDLLYHDQPRALILSKLLSIVYIFSFQNYWLAGLFFSFFSFMGSWYLADFLIKRYTLKPITVAISFFLFPSVVFWSSGILKESIMMGSIGFLIYFLLKGVEEKKIGTKGPILSVVFIGIIWIFKYYYAAILLPIIMAFVAMKIFIQDRFLQNNKIIGLFSFTILIGFIIFLATFLHPNLKIERVMYVLVENYENMKLLSKPENTAIFKNLTPDFYGIVKNAPWAVVTGLYRPFIWEAKNLFSMMVAMENLALLVITLMSLKNIGRLTKSENYLLIMGAILFIIIMAALLSISTPNFGSLARFRVGFMPFFLLLVLNPLFSKKI